MSYLDGSRWGPGALDEDGHDWSQFLDDRAAGYGLGGHDLDESTQCTAGPVADTEPGDDR